MLMCSARGASCAYIGVCAPGSSGCKDEDGSAFGSMTGQLNLKGLNALSGCSMIQAWVLLPCYLANQSLTDDPLLYKSLHVNLSNTLFYSPTRRSSIQ
jgi:hypothetical protein